MFKFDVSVFHHTDGTARLAKVAHKLDKLPFAGRHRMSSPLSAINGRLGSSSRAECVNESGVWRTVAASWVEK